MEMEMRVPGLGLLLSHFGYERGWYERGGGGGVAVG